MKLAKTKDTETEVLVLDYEEELEVARRFCVMLDLLWIEDRPKLFRPLCDLFYRKSYGLNFVAEELMELDDEIEHYNRSLKPSYAAEYGIPDFGFLEYEGEAKLTFDGDPANLKEKEDYDARQIRSRREVARAWKEAWEEHPKGWLHERFPDFPGEKVLHVPQTANERWDDDVKLERAFWAEVDRIQKEPDCSSRLQAFLYVRDYMERAKFIENELRDPHKDLVTKPVIDVEIWREGRRKDIEDDS